VTGGEDDPGRTDGDIWEHTAKHASHAPDGGHRTHGGWRPAPAGCAFLQADRSHVVTGPDGLRTFTLAPRGDVVMCNAYGSVDPLVGMLRAEPPVSREPVRVQVPDGHPVSVVWPEGFRVTFEPEAILHDPLGRVVAHEGTGVELDQTPRNEAAGTWADPYVAHGLAFGGCYPYTP
jgi:hypothetical protein